MKTLTLSLENKIFSILNNKTKLKISFPVDWERIIQASPEKYILKRKSLLLPKREHGLLLYFDNNEISIAENNLHNFAAVEYLPFVDHEFKCLKRNTAYILKKIIKSAGSFQDIIISS